MAQYNQSLVSDFRHNSEYKYIDLAIKSFVESPAVANRQLRFSETRDAPIINNASLYKMSVIRFQLDTANLPAYFFQIARNQANVDLGAYTVTLEHDDGAGGISTTNPENLTWVPQNVEAPIPSPPNANQFGLQEFTEYYWGYSYQHLLELMNTALAAAMVQLVALVPALAPIEAPFLSWNADSQTATIYARESHYDTDVFPQIRIYFNRPLYALFSTFSWLNFDSPQTNNKQHQLLMSRFDGEKVVVLPNFGIDKLIFSEQEITTIANMSPVSSLVFTSSTLPIVANDLSNPTVFIDGQQVEFGRTYNQSENIITDLSTNEDGFRPNLLYNPTAEYRYVSLLQNTTPIKQIDISVYWRDYLGRLQPFYMPPGTNASIKLLFKRLDAGEHARTHS